VLEHNRRDGYTVPAEGLYPYQWCWDSGPIALGWAAAGRWREAWDELRHLLSAQWSSGMVPHIVFWSPCDDYFPGPEVWDTRHDPPTTGITQPPLPASSAARLFVADPDRARARAMLRELWTRLVAWLGWIARARTGPHGASVIVHPWESGMDNAPCWDAPLEHVPSAGHPHLERRDVATVSAQHRPTDRDYRHYLGIVERLRAAGWDTEQQVEASPFVVEDVGFTAIAARAAADLAAIAHEVGEDPAPLVRFVEDARAALARMWDDDAGWFLPYDVRGERFLRPITATGLVALWAGVASSAQVDRMVDHMEKWEREMPFGVLTCDPAAPEFDPGRYWRGPVWVLVNWLVADGLARAGHEVHAERLRWATRSLVENDGFSEYYDARTGAGVGGQGFSWSAALTLAWLAPE
jgi:neutral trehalase